MRKLIIAALLVSSMAGWAQRARKTSIPIVLSSDSKHNTGSIVVQNHRVTTTGGKTLVQMGIVLDSLRVPSNRYRAFTPVIMSVDGAHQQRLKSLLVSGRTQNIVFDRDGIDPLYADNYDNVRRQNGEPQRYDYTDVVATQPWHQGARLVLECDLCGCGDPMKSDRYPLPLETAFFAAKYDFRDAVPAPDDKVYNLHGSAYITFVVDRWEMKPDYMNNRRELRKITDTLDIMDSDRNITVHRIKIHGWASPESPYAHNEMLATNRAKSLTNWLRQNYSLPDSVFAPAEATPENWIGLREAVEDMTEETLPHRSQILQLIDDNTLKPDPKEWKIKTRYPQEYRYLLTTVYPGLRRSDYDITFNVRKFTLQEACEVYKTQPYRLSLRELWDVAQTVRRDKAAYEKVLQTSYNLYPDSTSAMLNLARVALERDDLLKAETLLEHAGESALAENNRAILYMKQKRFELAEQALRRAEQKGMDENQNRYALKGLLKDQEERDEE